MKLGLLVFCALSSVCSVYGQVVDGSFWWLDKNNTELEDREHSGQISTAASTAATAAASTTASHATIENEVWCTCVTWYLCGDNNTIKTDGEGLLDIRSTAVVNVEECPVNEGDLKEICCGSRPASPDPSSPPTPIVTTPTAAVWCECVAQSLCNDDGVINTDGAGIFDIRTGTRDVIVNVQVCPNESEVCCGTPASTTTASLLGNVTEATSATTSSSTIASTTQIPIAPTGAPHGGTTAASSAISLISISLLQMLLIVTPVIVLSNL